MDATDRAIALTLMHGGRDRLSADEIRDAARRLECSTRTVYRYLSSIGRAHGLLDTINAK